MKVLFVAKGLFYEKGGAAIAAAKLVEELDAVVDTVILTDFIPSEKASISKNYAYLEKPAPSASPINYLKHNTWGTRTLHRLVEKISPDIIHVHSYAGFALQPPKKYPSIITIHDTPLAFCRDHISPQFVGWGSSLLNTFEQAVRRRLFNSWSYFHALSTPVKQDLLHAGVPEERIFILPNGVNRFSQQTIRNDRKRFLKRLGLPINAILAITIGAVGFRKGIHTIAQAAKTITETHPHIHFFIIGKIQSVWERLYYNAIIKGLGKRVPSNLHFTGFVSDSLLKRFFLHADLYINASYSEACNLGLLDAALRQIPIIATNVGAMHDLCGDSCSYFNFEDAKGLVKQLIKTVSEPRRPPQCELQSWKRIARKMVHQYQRILAKE